jgi:iron-sulfur cluster assembly accessory protein
MLRVDAVRVWRIRAVTDASFQVTPRALSRVSKILEGENAKALRVSVEGGGCSGFQYRYDLVDGPAGDDLVIEGESATVVVDPVSLPFLAGAQLDFVDDLMGQSFQIINPNAQSSCGCGTSFSLL